MGCRKRTLLALGLFFFRCLPAVLCSFFSLHVCVYWHCIWIVDKSRHPDTDGISEAWAHETLAFNLSCARVNAHPFNCYCMYSLHFIFDPLFNIKLLQVSSCISLCMNVVSYRRLLRCHMQRERLLLEAKESPGQNIPSFSPSPHCLRLVSQQWLSNAFVFLYLSRDFQHFWCCQQCQQSCLHRKCNSFANFPTLFLVELTCMSTNDFECLLFQLLFLIVFSFCRFMFLVALEHSSIHSPTLAQSGRQLSAWSWLLI